MLKLQLDKMQKAIQRAKEIHPKVKAINVSDRTYAVTGSKGDTYTVRFVVANGHKLAECDCAARGLCFHIAAAYQANVLCQSFRTRGAEVEPSIGQMAMHTARHSGWLI